MPTRNTPPRPAAVIDGVEIFTLAQVAARLGVSRELLAQRISDGTLDGIGTKVAGAWLFTYDQCLEVRAAMDARREMFQGKQPSNARTKMNVVERKYAAERMKSEGKTHRQIADALGYTTVEAVSRLLAGKSIGKRWGNRE